ncbi:unnamed protein product [Lota lota]
MESVDKRLDFIRDVVLKGYRLRLDDWRELMAEEGNGVIFTTFFDNVDYQRLLFSLDASSRLVVQLDFFQNSAHKVMYFIRRDDKVITKDNVKRLLIGEVPGDLVDASIAVTNEIVIPLLASQAKTQCWPKVMADDVLRHTKKLRDEMTVFHGQMQGQTFLPLPVKAETPGDDASCRADSQMDPMMMHEFETLVINWTHQISDVLKEDSASPLLKGLNPLPSYEFDFWNNRLVNLQGLHAQLRHSKVRKMAYILKNTSVYWPTLNQIYMDVSEALREALDVTLYLKPIQKILETVGQMEYAKLKTYTIAVMHTVALTWANSEYYCRPCRIIVILQEMFNLYIDMTKTFIGPEKVMKGLTQRNDDIQANIGISIQTIMTLKESYQSCKSRMGGLFKNGNAKNWDFPSNLVFSRLDIFLERLTTIEEIYSVSAQMYKLESVAIQGLRGGDLEISTIYEEFCDHVTLFSECKYDVFDTNDKRIEEHNKLFLDKMIDFELRLGTVLCKAFDVCPSPESAVKLLVMFSFILDRPQVQAQLMPKYKELIGLFIAELDNVKLVFDAQIATTGVGTSTPLFCKNMPPVAGQLKWALELAERIQTTMKGFRALPQLDVHTQAKLVFQKYDEMTQLLHQYQVVVYSEWTSRVDKDCQFNLKQPLVLRNKGNILSVNFSSQLVEVLREVKYLRIQGRKNIPPSAADMFAHKEVFRKYVGNLDLVVSWYNEIQATVLPSEFPLIEGELKSIDMELAKAETIMFWNGEGVWEYIKSIGDMMHDLYRRVNQAKANVDSMCVLMAEWSLTPMFERKDNKNDSLLDLKGRPAVLNKRYTAIRDSGQKLRTLLEENKTLYRANDATESWMRHVDYIDDKVLDGFFEVVLVSLQFLASSMHATSGKAPLFAFALTLDDRTISLSPSLSHGFIEMVDNLITDVYHAADLIPRISLTNTTSYQYELKEKPELSKIYEDVMNAVREAVMVAQQYSDTWLHYDFLWMQDRDEFMKQFLGKEIALEHESRTPPTLEEFKKEIDTYENLHSEVSQLEDSTLILCWLQIDIWPFKHSLLNTIKRWSLMFKQCLIDRVNNSLQDQERFNKEVIVGLTKTLHEGDYQGLIEVLVHLMRVKESQASTESMFEPLNKTVELLKDYGEELPDEVYAKLEDLPQQWNIVKKTSLQAKQNVARLQAHEAVLIHSRCQKFETELQEFSERFRQQSLFNFTCVMPYEALTEARTEIELMKEEMEELKRVAGLFEVNVPEYKLLKACSKEMSLLKELWDMISLVNRNLGEWKTTLWKNIDLEDMRMRIAKYAKDIQVLDKEMRAWDAYSGLESLLNNQLTSLRTLVDLQNPTLRNRHWLQLMMATKIHFEMSDKTTFEDLLQLNLHNFEEEVDNIVDKAVKEAAMEETLATLDSTWSNMALKPVPHSATGTMLLGPNVELFETLEDSLVQLQTLMTSKYIYHLLEEVSGWQQKLSTVDLVLSVWFAIQQTYTSLESIFIFSEDLSSQLPENCKNFDRIAHDFKEMILEAVEVTNIIKVTNRKGLMEKLKCLEEGLGLCKRALADYLETKRLAFPRFYFLSNNDLLDVLSHGQNPIKVNTHLSKLFDSLSNLKFDLDHDGEPTKTAHGMFSIEKEYVVFDKDCECSGQVEQWLDKVQERMVNTLREKFGDAIMAYKEKPKDQWLFDYPAQVAVVTTQIWWTTEVNIALTRLEDGKENAVKDLFKKQVSQLNMLIKLLIKEHSQGDRQKIKTILTMDVHARDVVAKLISNKIDNAKAFMWVSQLRHHWEENSKHCLAKLCDAEFRYSYEYLGNTARLVITPLTDRCYITLTQSLHHGMGAAPTGPACTGKTETIKDLGKALGIMVYVCNCSDQMDYKSLGDIYKGLAQTGAWGCFDQFERISVEVLSVIAMQVKCVQDGIREKRSTFNFLGQIIKLVPTFGAFITLNPGYSGRAELPENLKALFRPCAMVVPDFELICQILLVAEGFTNAQILAKKFISLLTFCKQLLSRQEHYDWGLRAIKSMLVVAGSLKREDPSRPEDQVLMRALRDFNLPMIVVDDMPVFMELIGDLFPSLDVPRERDKQFEEVVRQSVLDLKLQADDRFVLKVLQLEELLAVRHSVFIIGDTGTGKSMVIKSLKKTYQNMKRNPVVVDLDPKAVTCDELFGVIHPVTREWKDGLFSFLMRKMANTSNDDAKWIILDGDIDPMWTECLNSVMDDNKVLTLASNERIPLSPSMRLVFEMKDLRMATPATMSRAGILFINPSDLGWNAVVVSWMDKREVESEKANLSILFDQYLPTCLEKLKSSFKKMTAIPEMSLVQTLLYIMEGLLVPENTPPDSSRELYELYLVFACVWAFGGAMSQDQLTDYRVEFSKWWLNEFKKVKFPSSGTVFDYYIDCKTKTFVPWTEKLPTFVLQPELQLQTTLVHTTETIRLCYFMDMLIDQRRPIMLVGNAATGKSLLMAEMLRTLPTDQYMIQSIPFNYCTTSAMLQAILENNLTKKAGKSYGPMGSKRLIYFIDDLNLPEVDKYHTVSPHTLIRQHLDQGHWYDRTKLTLKEIDNCQYVVCMNPTAGSFPINPRLQRHFVVLGVSYPGQNSLKSIYNSILSQHWERSGFTSAVKHFCSTLVNASLMFHQKMSSSFLPTAVKCHYIFNLRDLSNVFQGLLYTKPDCGRSPVEIVHLWLHECNRVYGDKLVDETDSQSFSTIQTEIVKNFFEDMDQAYLLEKPIYCYFSEGARQTAYAPIKNVQSLNNILHDALTHYNEVYGVMSLVLFEDAMSHICRINRILGSWRRSALLIGVFGTGKKSLTRLAASLSNLEVFQISSRRGYGVPDLKTDLAALCMKAGVKNVGSVLLMADDQVIKDEFLALISDLLVSGEIPNLFHDDEVENMIKAMQHEVRKVGLPDSRENCWKLFNDRVKDHIKVVFCFSPLGSTLRVRARKFPALLNCTAIDWFHEWPEKALVSISTNFLCKTEAIEPHIKDSVGQFMAYAHMTVIEKSKSYLLSDQRHNYATPNTFLEHIKLFQKLLGLKRNQLLSKIDHLKNVLTKLMNTSSQVKDVNEKLEFQMEALEQKRVNVERLRDAIGQEAEKLSKEQAIADDEEIKAKVNAQIIEEGPLSNEESLAKAEAAQLAADEDLSHLDKNNLTDLKSMGSPPVAVVNVMAAVMILLAPGGKIPKDKSWKAAKISMAEVDVFLKSLINFNAQTIPEPCIKAAQPFIDEPTFEPDSISSLSTAAAALCSWCLNIMKLCGARCDVESKKLELAKASTALASSQQKLSVITAKINQLNSKLAKMKEEFGEATMEKLKCQKDVDSTNLAISLSGRLVVSLAAESVRWSETVAQLQIQEKTLTGDVLLSASFVSYLGYFTKKYRTDLIDNYWLPYLKELKVLISTHHFSDSICSPENRNLPFCISRPCHKVSIPITEDLDPLTFLTDDAEIASWSNHGLLSDRMFIENVAILCNTERWPLIVDSQLQCIKWITNKFGNNLKVIRLKEKGSMNTIENAVSNGDILLIEDISETVEPMLDSLLRRKTIKNGKYIQIGDKEIEYHPDFRLILHTKCFNPHFKPKMQAHCALINFLFTHEGVEEQLLAAVVAKERPDLEKNKVDLRTQQNNIKISLSQLEESLLACLSSDSFLSDDGLVENLETTKSTATQFQDKIKESKTKEKEINEAREHYRPAAVRAALLYFILNDLNKIQPIYQFSLKAFGNVFEAAIIHTKPAKDVKQRVRNLIDQITYSVFLYTKRSLFEHDRLTFIVQMAFQILLLEKQINPKELEFLLHFPFKAGLNSPVEFLSNECWGGIKALSKIDDFENLDQDIEYSPGAWRKIVETGSPEKEKFPQEWKKKAGLQKLCMLRCLRPDRMCYAIKNFVEEKFGNKYVERTKFEFANAYQESSPSTTVFFIVSPGVDPVADVEVLGKELGFTAANGKFHNFSMGQGQETLAEAALHLAAKEGHWVMLQNIHLVHNWLGCLDKHIEKNSVGSHQDYRVFMSAEPPASFESHVIPRGLLENAIKITNEAPSGMQDNLHKALNLFSQETLDMCSMDSEFKRILFALCYFHAVVTERQKFGAQGWNMTYPFSNTDLTISVNVLYSYLEANSKVLWEDLQYLFGEIVYGGHIMDYWDRKLCRTYLEEYIRPELLEGTLKLAPGFTAPPNLDCKSSHSYIVKNLPAESPHLYGLHPNAEIDFLSVTSDRLFGTILEIQAKDCGTATGDGESREDNVKRRLEEILEELPQGFNIATITAKIEARTPYNTVAIQECQRMNILLKEISRSLEELNLGLKGGLTITKDMEDLSIALCSDTVPESWTKLAYPSLQGLAGWYTDLLLRFKELETWTADMAFPTAVWLPGLFSPQSFLTAVMQFVARKNKWPLEKMCLSVEVMKKNREEFSCPPREGAYIYGLFMEGARWDPQKGVMAEARLRELTPSMPVLFVKALPLEQRETNNMYECPVYRTRTRGATYIWTFPLRSKERPAKWVLATACLLLSK